MLLPEIAAVAAAHRGVFLRPHALAAGYTDDEIRRFHSTKEWHRVRRGAYCEAVVWKAADEPERHRMRVHAALMVLREPAVVSHQSAAVVLGLTLWGAPLDLVHVTRTDLHSPRIEGGIHHHAGALESGDVLVVDGLPVTSAARTSVDVAREHGAEVGLVTADSAVARPDCSVGQLRATAARLSDWRGARAAGRVASMADPRSESAAESRFRYLWYLAGGPELDLQVEVTVGGMVIARLDALDFDGNTAHEVDGRVKYDGEDGRDVVWQEKLRQDAVHRYGWRSSGGSGPTSSGASARPRGCAPCGGAPAAGAARPDRFDAAVRGRRSDRRHDPGPSLSPALGSAAGGRPGAASRTKDLDPSPPPG